MQTRLKVVIPRFPTHIQTSSGKYQKISGNSIYSGLHYAIRNKVFKGMHDFLLSKIPDANSIMTPVIVSFTFHVPINYGDVRRRAGGAEVSWKVPDEDYIPRWDVDNLAWPWIKAALDTLVKKMVLEDDTVEQVQGIQYQFIPCETLDQRKIVINIETLNNVMD